MQLDALLTRQLRLQNELTAAYRQLPWHSSRIDELAVALASVEHEISSIQSAANDSFIESGNCTDFERPKELGRGQQHG